MLDTAPLGSTPDWSIYWGPQDERAAVRGIQAALDGGVTWIDTAPYYGWGRAEELVGRAIRGRGPDALVFTKCGTLRGGEGGEHVDLTPAAIRRDLEASLRRLGRDHVDMLQLHDPDPNVSIEESWTEVQRLIAAGSVRYGGLSNHPLALVERATTIAPVAAVQYRYNLLSRDIERDALPYGRANGVGVLSWGSLAEGLLSDSFTVEELDAHDFRRARPNFREPRYSRIQRFVAELAGIAAAAGSTTAGVAIAWLLARPGLTGAIVGVRSESEGRALADAGQLRLPSAVFEQVDEALQRYERGER